MKLPIANCRLLPQGGTAHRLRTICLLPIRACPKIVASAILADAGPELSARRLSVVIEKTPVIIAHITLRMLFPGGKMPPSTAGKDACHHIFRQALEGRQSLNQN